MSVLDQVNSIPMWRRPKLSWVRVTVRGDCSGFTYRDRAGELQVVRGGETAEIDSETYEARRRSVERVG